MITPGVSDSSAAYFEITNITGGTLYQNNGTTPIANGSFITLAQGAAGLKFTPTPGSLAGGSFNVQESTTNAVGGLSGATATATINVTLAGPSVTNAATTAENPNDFRSGDYARGQRQLGGLLPDHGHHRGHALPE